MKKIQPHKTQTVGPYSPAIKFNNFIFTSGQIGLNSTGELAGDDIKDQCLQALENLKTVLKSAGSSPQKVIKTTIFLTDIKDYAQINDIYADFFHPHKPSRSTVAVAALPKQAKIEIEAIATV